MKVKAKGKKPPPINIRHSSSRLKTEKKETKRYTCVSQKNSSSSSPSPEGTCAFCGLSINRTYNGISGELVYHSCFAQICLKCLHNILDRQHSCKVLKLFCPICFLEFDPAQLGKLHPELNNIITEQLTLNSKELSQMVQCRFCSNKFIFEETEPDFESIYHDTKLNRDRKLTRDQAICVAKNSMCCNECGISCCRQCNAVPFHNGETCKEHQWFVEGYVCHICGQPVDPSKAPKGQIALLHCDHPECQNIDNQMCQHVHACGHACVGIRGEKQHPFCPECTEGGSLCPHCDRDLWGTVCLSLKCGHVIHYECALEIMKRPRTGPELNLPLCPAPGCGEFVNHDCLRKELPKDFREWKELEHQIDLIAKNRVIAEGIEFHPEVTSKLSPFSQAGDKAALSWAKKRLKFMTCTKHPQQIVYTCGRIEDYIPDDDATSCPVCPNYKFPVCPTHKYDFMAYKCESCCSIGVRRSKSKSRNSSSTVTVWTCEICHDMPGRSDSSSNAPCKGNCKFSPHTRSRTDYYGKCMKCGAIVSKPRPFQMNRGPNSKSKLSYLNK